MKRWLLIIPALTAIAGLLISWYAAVAHTAPVRFSAGPISADFPVPLVAVSFRTADGLTLHGWYGRVPDEHATVVLLHRYRAGRGFMLSRARWYAERGYSVFLYDARATGESGGNRISVGWHEQQDLLAALQWVREQGARHILCHGVSQGGATILLAADQLGNDIVGVIVESTYDTLINAGDRRFRMRTGLPGWLVGAAYRLFMEHRLGFDLQAASPVHTIPHLAAPVFILSGSDDAHTWEQDTRRLYAAATSPATLWIVPGARHEDLLAYDATAYQKRLTDFLVSIGLRSVPGKDAAP
jgi:uncharacterized protein